MNASERGRQILIAMIASRLIPLAQRLFHVTLTVADVGDLLVAAIALWHAAAASWCMWTKRFFPDPTESPISPQERAGSSQ